MKSQRLSQRVLISAAMAVAGGIIVIVSLPSWMLLSMLGAGMLAGAYLIYKNGL
ncbi:MAG: hypothetical protein ACM3WU_02140 [Bacillota bacterium]